MGFDLIRMGFTVIGIVIASIIIFKKRDTIKGSYTGSLYVISFGLIFFLFMIVAIYDSNVTVSTRLIIDFLVFKKISAKGANPYLREMGYVLTIIGLECFVLALIRRKKLKSNK